MKFFELNFATLLLRYYFMMGVIIVGGFVGQWWLAAIGFFVFLSAIMGISVEKEGKQAQGAKLVKLETGSKEKRQAV
jgi:UPF0716 family protein affecting phage T7 exclusion